MLDAGSLVFSPPNHPVDLKNWGQWWTLRGASWRRPYGPKSNIDVLDSHPVVHVAYADALAPKILAAPSSRTATMLASRTSRFPERS
jgi:Sulfatase-modifying factor enzyme 1